MLAHKTNYDTLTTTDLPEKGTREWYLARHKRRTGQARGGGRPAKFREIAKYKQVSFQGILEDELPKYVESEYWFYVWNVGILLCIYCGDRLTKHNRTQDHIIPKAKGGSDLGRENLMPCCGDCNRAKGHKSLLEFMIDGGLK